MKERRNTNILYAIVGVATLMLSIVGATFAYFTATADNTTAITGDSATIGFDVTVTKMTSVDVDLGGLIPMSNNMMEQALTKNAGTKGVCVDDNGNAVCQVYKITVINNGTASMFVDGYVTLTNGSGTPADYTSTKGNATSMRWSQAFCSEVSNGKVTTCTTAGNSTVRSTNAIALTSPKDNTTTTLGGANTKGDGTNTSEIKTAKADVTYAATHANAAVIKGNKYEVIKNNYIRVSDHLYTDTTYTRTEDITSALVFNQYLDATDGTDNHSNATSSTTLTDSQVYFIVVWLCENGHNQTAGSDGAGAAQNASNFFQGTATFIASEGTEVSATFNGLTRVAATDNNAAAQS